MKTHEEMVAQWVKDPEFKAEYDALEEEFSIFDALVEARRQAGLTQEEVARRMGTKPPAIARLESSGGQKKPSPTLNTLQKYAKALGCRLELRLVPRKKGPAAA
jgi:transcriptional regulator with XRE-family HTH domain